MASMTSLWLPILLSAVLVFIASFILHMVLRYHQKDFEAIPNEEQARTALRSLNLNPGEYLVPHGGSPEAMKDPVFIEKMKTGPIVLMVVRKPGSISMGSSLLKWFIYCVVVSVFAAYIASRAASPGTDYLQVFRFAGAVAFIGYGLAIWQSSIWYGRPVRTNVLLTIDALIYGLLTAGVFGWLWPR